MSKKNTRAAKAAQRRAFVLRALAGDNPAYDVLVRQVVAQFPERSMTAASIRAARVVRDVLWRELATVESDETMWLTARGWAALRELEKSANGCRTTGSAAPVMASAGAGSAAGH